MLRSHRCLVFITAMFTLLSAPLFAGGSPEDSLSPETRFDTDNTPSAPVEGFPVVIEHKYGTITIPSPPARVVSVGYSEHDVLLALGVIPVGVRDWYGDQPYATWPWAQDELGDGTPQIIGAGELDIEAIVALNPDLIVGVGSGMTADEYALLSRIAPTLAQSAEYLEYGTPWDEETLLIGRALGRDEQAAEIVASLRARMEQAKTDNPAFVGASGAVAFVFRNERGAFSSQDSRSRILQQLGFVVPARYDQIAGDSFYLTISDELIELLDTDVVVWVSTTADGPRTIQRLPLRDTMRAYQEGREIFLDPLTSAALSFASPLSLSYALDVIVPGLTAAIDGDRSTAVPANLR